MTFAYIEFVSVLRPLEEKRCTAHFSFGGLERASRERRDERDERCFAIYSVETGVYIRSSTYVFFSQEEHLSDLVLSACVSSFF